jgi:hypothetical protein
MSDDSAMRDDEPVRDDDPVRSGDPDRDAVDRAFAELVAGYHLTAERPEPPPWDASVPGSAAEPGTVFEPPRPRSDHDLPEREPSEEERPELHLPDLSAPAPKPEPDEGFRPGPPPPLPRPAWPVLVGWIGLGYAMLTVLLVAIGVPLPVWAAWAGVIGFVGGFGLLVSRLPRQRPPDAGDGAVL